MVMGSAAVKQFLNVMTYLGYPDSSDPASSGMSDTAYFKRREPGEGGMASFVPYLFNKMQAFTMRGMPPSYTPTKRVYIVLHGGGLAYSKIQLSEVYLEPGGTYRFILRLRHAVL
jgi:PAB1-binding protein PBP1